MAKFKVQTQNGCHEEVEGETLAFDRGAAIIFNAAGSTVAMFAQPQSVRKLSAETDVSRPANK